MNPKCKDCGNTKEFIVAYIEFEVLKFDNGKIIDSYAGDRERCDEQYKPKCQVCKSTNIENVEII